MAKKLTESGLSLKTDDLIFARGVSFFSLSTQEE